MQMAVAHLISVVPSYLYVFNSVLWKLNDSIPNRDDQVLGRAE